MKYDIKTLLKRIKSLEDQLQWSLKNEEKYKKIIKDDEAGQLIDAILLTTSGGRMMGLILKKMQEFRGDKDVRVSKENETSKG